MRDLTITVMQANLRWEDAAANRELFSERIASLKERPDLVALPEMFTTGFTMNAEAVAEEMDGPTVEWMTATARGGAFHLAGSLVIREEGRFYNRLVWACPDGKIISYDKRHLFRMAGEEQVYSAGSSLLTARVEDWKIRPFICYDLRFPLWCRNRNGDYDAALYVANWPEKRASHWKTLLAARAIENQCYVIGCNRTGFDGNGVTYSGDSSVIDYQGRVMIRETGGEGVLTVRLSGDELDAYRKSFPVWMDADEEGM
ncbi:MAG TPA: amidohydrolase [Spirochaetota bacterium]|nr:amidohydrolase [Spirochaetota bacterium]